MQGLITRPNFQPCFPVPQLQPGRVDCLGPPLPFSFDARMHKPSPCLPHLSRHQLVEQGLDLWNSQRMVSQVPVTAKL